MPSQKNPAHVPSGASPLRRAAAEAGGTFLLVFGLIGAALLTSPDSNGVAAQPGTGLLGVAVALGLTVAIGAAVVGPISGGHFNPAVTIGVAVAGRLRWGLVPVYLAAQVVGGVAGAALVRALLLGSSDGGSAAVGAGFASTGYGMLSPGHFGLLPVAAVELVATAVLVVVVLTTTHPTTGTPLAPLVIGGTLTLMLFVALPIDNASLNPARSLATAVFGGGDWLAQLWAFVVFPVLGAAVAAGLYRVATAGRASAAPASPASPASAASDTTQGGALS
ncbi:aquaporin [Herbiconiux sp. VKM Ac-1786]|uniref:aquaporin n=1 Tax=Herbiconiux sp. VKM Ac-1786 TaxID=2783824 RepID=UPI00188D05CB|nr:aquaporin [Herbiconiux sp. VKM Ac-1786]MBF4574211.1 aquaporin [Herbiconiux sp. VKM Ac-1786]